MIDHRRGSMMIHDVHVMEPTVMQRHSIRRLIFGGPGQPDSCRLVRLDAFSSRVLLRRAL